MDTDSDANIALILQLQEEEALYSTRHDHDITADEVAAKVLQEEEYAWAGLKMATAPLGYYSTVDVGSGYYNSGFALVDEQDVSPKRKTPSGPTYPTMGVYCGDKQQKKLPTCNEHVQLPSLAEEATRSTQDGFEAIQLYSKTEQQQLQTVQMETASCIWAWDDEDDAHLARTLVSEETQHAMEVSFSGKAWNFVHAMLEEHKEKTSQSSTTTEGAAAAASTFEPVATDDMHFMVTKLAEAQEVFRVENKDIHIDIGYHYTKSENLSRIKTNGLLTCGERLEKGVHSNYNGSAYGDGVYTANDPYSYNSYGDVGLMVARLRGDARDATPGGVNFVGDTAVALRGTPGEMVILRNSYQCVPLLRFSKAITTQYGNNNGDDGVMYDQEDIWRFHLRLQGLIDRFFNGGIQTDVNIIPPPFETVTRPLFVPAFPSTLRNERPSLQKALPSSASSVRTNKGRCDKCLTATHKVGIDQSLTPLTDTEIINGTCIRCNPEMVPSSALAKFHDKYRPGTPFRSETYRSNVVNHPIVGTAPTMRVLWYKNDVLSCDNNDTIVIVYNLSFNDGYGWKSASYWKVFLPDDQACRGLLDRLKDAFCTGAMFHSCHQYVENQSKQPNCSFSWTPVPHKTSPLQFPDTDYVLECNKVLDRLGVPHVGDCDSSRNLLQVKTKPEFYSDILFAKTFCQLEQLLYHAY